MSTLTKYRLVLSAFILGLILSGVTAFPLAWEMRLLTTLFGINPSLPPEHYSGLAFWLATVSRGLHETYGGFHISELRKRYCMEIWDPGGLRGHCPPVGDVYWEVRVIHPQYRPFQTQIDSQIDPAKSPPHPGPYDKQVPAITLRPILLTPKQ